MRSPITTHVLNTATGRPAAGVAVQCFIHRNDSFERIATCRTDDDGRVAVGLIDESQFVPGRYRLRWLTGEYFDALGDSSFYPEVTVDFKIEKGQAHTHVPLLISPFGYSTYRGS